MKHPLVSIITVNFNQARATMALLWSLKELTYKNHEVLVVDNASPNDELDSAKELFPNVLFIKSERNLGFAGGNNLGVKVAKGDYLLFVNNDTEVPPGFIEPLLKTFADHPRAGMVSPKIKYAWNPEIIQYAGFTPMNRWSIRNQAIGHQKRDDGTYDKEGKTASAHGAAMMVPKAIVEKVGPMPELYFLYYEELDWAEAIKRAGYDIYYQPKTHILHKESLSTGKLSPLKTYYISRNRIVFARRNFKTPQLLVSLMFQLLVSIPKNSLSYLAQGQLDHLGAFWRALFWNMRHYKVT